MKSKFLSINILAATLLVVAATSRSAHAGQALSNGQVGAQQLGLQQQGYIKITGVGPSGQEIPTPKLKYYVVHGGCRLDSNQNNQTEIWLYLSQNPNTQYDPNSRELFRAYMFVTGGYEDSSSLNGFLTCKLLRQSRINQTAINMELVDHPYWATIKLVKSVLFEGNTIEVSPIDKQLLGNFSVRN